MKALDYLVAIAAIGLCLFNYTNALIVIPLYLCICAYALGRIGWVVNIASIIILLAGFKVLEWVLYGLILPYGNYVIYPAWFLIDLAIYFCLIWRAPAMRQLCPKQAGEFCITNADVVLGGIHLVYCVVALLAFVEHCLRHLNDFGFDAKNSTVIWLYDNARFIYNAYPYIKTTLNGLELFAIFCTAGRFMQSPRVLSA